MRKFKNVICVLLVAIMASVLFVGCGKDRSAEDIKNLYTNVKNSFTVNNKNYLFKNESDGTISNAVFITYEGEMSKISDITRNFEGVDASLYYRYSALQAVQQSILDTIFNYYNTWTEDFYKKTDIANVDKKDMKTLYNSVEEYEEVLQNFEVARKKVESDVEIMTFNGAIRSNLTSYAYEFNKLIDGSFKLANTFKDIYNKYYFTGEIVDKKYYLDYCADEFALEITEAMYVLNIKAFNNVNECDLSAWKFGVSNDNSLSSLYEWAFTNLSDVLTFKDKIVLEEDKINENYYNIFIENRKVFKQRFGVLKEVCASTDMYHYVDTIAEFYNFIGREIGQWGVNNPDIGEEQLIEMFYESYYQNYPDMIAEYKESLPVVEAANINLIEGFNELCRDYIASFEDVMNLGV